MSYGLAVNNANGDILFDSRRQMDSYVVAYYGRGTGAIGTFNDLIFVKGEVAVKDKLVVCQKAFNQNGSVTYSFHTFDPSTKTLSAAISLDYMHLMQSATIGPDTNDNFGLQIKNPDGTIQFDSRSLKSDAHYTIVDVHRRLELFGNGLGSALTTDSSQYIEVARTTSASAIINAAVSSIKFTGANGNIPIYYNYIETGFFPVVTNFRYNTTSMFIAELEV